MGNVVVMVHGAGGGAWEWNVWRAVFAARGVGVCAVELVPSVGGGLAGTSLDDYVRQVVAASAAPTGASVGVVLVGASLGGLLALMAAPSVRPSAIVLVNPLPPSPFHSMLPARDAYPAVVPWRRDASLAGTRAVMPDALDAACLHAFERWRDESGLVMNAARAGVAAQAPRCPVLVMASELDDDVPVAASAAMAAAWGATLVRLAGASHVGPLLGRDAARHAEVAVAWIEASVR
jgi:pimeloyl-ACP methyl ester carboxylesterase